MLQYKTVTVLSLLILGLCGSLSFAENDKPQAKPAGNDSFWQEELSRPEPPMTLPEEKIDQFLGHIRKQNPARADELERLRKDNPEQFNLEIREEFIHRFRQMRQQPGADPAKARPERPEAQPGLGEHGPVPPDQPRMPVHNENRGQWRDRLERMHNDLLAWLEKNAPDQAVELKQLRENRPEEYVMRTAELMRKYGPIMQAEKDNPKLADVMKDDLENQRQRDELLRQIRMAESKEKEKLICDLKQLVYQRFDLIIAKKQLQYDELRKRLENLQKEVKTRENELEKQKANKDKAVEEHVAELVAKIGNIPFEQP